ncbi:MAG: DUF2937 family protein [Roseibium sp.]|nr:DUF2937 family protein [Roseibium sp.]
MARIFVLIAMLFSGTATSQLPEFAQQYRQRLGGAIDALQEVVSDFKRDADAFGMSFEQAVDRLKDTPDPFSQQRGRTMEETHARLDRLSAQQQALETSGPFYRIGVFLSDLDPDLARATAGDYEPALPVTTEGIVSAGIGGLCGFIAARVLMGLARLGRRRHPVSG